MPRREVLCDKHLHGPTGLRGRRCRPLLRGDCLACIQATGPQTEPIPAEAYDLEADRHRAAAESPKAAPIAGRIQRVRNAIEASRRPDRDCAAAPRASKRSPCADAKAASTLNADGLRGLVTRLSGQGINGARPANGRRSRLPLSSPSNVAETSEACATVSVCAGVNQSTSGSMSKTRGRCGRWFGPRRTGGRGLTGDDGKPSIGARQEGCRRKAI